MDDPLVPTLPRRYNHGRIGRGRRPSPAGRRHSKIRAFGSESMRLTAAAEKDMKINETWRCRIQIDSNSSLPTIFHDVSITAQKTYMCFLQPPFFPYIVKVLKSKSSRPEVQMVRFKSSRVKCPGLVKAEVQEVESLHCTSA